MGWLKSHGFTRLPLADAPRLLTTHDWRALKASIRHSRHIPKALNALQTIEDKAEQPLMPNPTPIDWLLVEVGDVEGELLKSGQTRQELSTRLGHARGVYQKQTGWDHRRAIERLTGSRIAPRG